MLLLGPTARTIDSRAVKTCGSCGAGNSDDARFCATCGASLAAACPRCGSELPDGARFCPSCGLPVGQPAPAPSGQERRLVTILFADVTGSTGLGERLDPERLQEVMGSYFSAMRQAIEAEGGTVEKFIGDAVMAAFGVPSAHEDDPARAVRAALGMRRALDDLNRDLSASHGLTLDMRIGVNTGEVLAATSPQPGEPMVTGDAVNVAARLEQSAEPGQIVVAERTARAARSFRFRELGPVELKGKDQPVPAVLVLDLPEHLERGVPGLSAPMVGRDQELQLLGSVFERVASEGRTHLVTIYGDAGVGKSRLTTEFLARAEATEPRPLVVRGRCPPYGEGVTYWPFAEILKGLGGVRDSDPPEVALDKIRSLGRELLSTDVASNPAKATAALAFTVGVEDPSFSFRGLEPREVRRKTHDAWRSFFSALAARAPVVVVVEDIHWADAALLELLEDLGDRVIGPVLLVCPSRPELTERRPDWGGGRRNFSSIALEPLSQEDADRLVSLLLSVEDLPASVHRRILERAEGNPFFLEEIVRQLIDEGRIVREADRWRARAGIEEVVIPDTIQAVLAARIDLLPRTEKRALQGAAVVGRVFWPGPVRRLLNGDGDALEETFGRLEDRELVRSRLSSSIAGEPEFIFKHVLTREVAYESLPRRERIGAHAAVASWIEETTGERTHEFVELLAYHYEEAHRAARDDARTDPGLVESLRARAFRSLLQASEEARRRYAVQKALRLADRALSLATTPLHRAEALEQIGTAARNDYRGDLAWRSLREAAELRAQHAPEDPIAIARVCAKAVDVPTRWPGSMREVPSEQEVGRFLDLGFAHVGDGDSEELVRLLSARAFGPWAVGTNRQVEPEEFEAARAAGLEAADIAMRLGRLDLASGALDGASSANITMGDYGKDMPLIERRIGLSASVEDPWEIGDIFAMGAWGTVFVGDYERSVELAEEGIRRAGAEAEGTHLHLLAWASLAEFSRGNWTRVVDEFLPRGEALLGDRANDPPYFTANLFGAAAFILDARGDAAAESRMDLIGRIAAGGQTHSMMVSAWLAWIHARHDRFDDAIKLLEAFESLSTKVARPLVEQVRAEVLAEAGLWDDVPDFVAAARAYASRAELRALPVHIDRLEGRTALAVGRRGEALSILQMARAGFDQLGARWEVACTDLSLAEALIAADRREDARARLDGAIEVFEELRSLREIERSRELLAKLG
jgi:class 3 adenylate cyclase/tetratricopeptide (TPR) repeat protein